MEKQSNSKSVVPGVVSDAAPGTATKVKSVKFSVPPKPEEYAALVEATRHNFPHALALWQYHVEQNQLTPQNSTTPTVGQEPRIA